MDWFERAEEELERDWLSGQITKSEYEQAIRDLYEDARASGYWDEE